MNKIKSILLLSLSYSCLLLFSIGPHPNKKDNAYEKHKQLDIFTSRLAKNSTRKRSLPENILVIRAEFQDVKFSLEPNTETNPDEWPHDKEYFDTLMVHVKTYWQEASYGNYIINPTVLDTVVTLSKNMGYYGDDEKASERVVELTQEAIELADEFVDYNNYDEIMIFHAGPGQESDMSGNNTDDIWTTFLTIDDLQEVLDSENDNYEGILTDDGKYITQTPILPESEWQPDNDPLSEDGSEAPIGIFGVVNHEFGHTLGLPTLFDNDSSDGKGYGIGNFGIMGTGSWNANGHFPPLPIIWCRYYLGWEEPTIITSDQEELEIASFFSDSEAPKSYIIPINDKEYFLLQNLSENPDNSALNIPGGYRLQTHTFELLEEGQDYYPGENSHFPKFNFMENTYAGSEWNFYCPGLGGPNAPFEENDGSGLLIWHIDENIIKKKLTSDLQENSINSYYLHKGVDLEEADGVQHLDNTFQSNKVLGSQFDSFKAEDNNYFGLNCNPISGELSLPTAASYYGGVEIEINILTNAIAEMKFSVNFIGDKFTADYSGENPFPPIISDLDKNGKNDIIYSMPNDSTYIWINDELYNKIYIGNPSEVYTKRDSSYIFPSKINNNSLLYSYNYSENPEKLTELDNANWSGPMLSNLDSLNFNNKEIDALIGYNKADSCGIILYEKDSNNQENITLDGQIRSNFAKRSRNETVFFIIDNDLYSFNSSFNLLKSNITELENTEIISIGYATDIDNNGSLIIQTINKIVVIQDNDSYQTSSFNIKENNYSLMNIYDINKNGKRDIILVFENGFTAYELSGEKINIHFDDYQYPDSLSISAPVLATDINNDGTVELLGNYSKNRFDIWNLEQSSLDNFPISLNERSRNMPILRKENDSLFVYIGMDNGIVYRRKLNFNSNINNYSSNSLYRDIYRSSEYNQQLENIFINNSTIIKEKTFIYPCPFVGTDHDKLYFQTMINQDADISLKIYNVAGNLIHKKIYDGYAYQKNVYTGLNTTNLASGVYFALIEVKGDFVKRKFVIEK